jgi:hypothetical protein
MGIDLKTFFLYRITTSLVPNRYLLLRVERPGYSNAFQCQENEAYDIQEKWRELTFDYYISEYLEVSESLISCELIAESDELPLGEDLYVDEIILEMTIYASQTTYGDPWRLFGTASDKADFWTQATIEAVDDAYKPFPPINSYTVIFIPDNAVLSNKKSLR